MLAATHAVQAGDRTASAQLSLSELEQRRNAIQAELKGLAHVGLRGGMGAAGVRSRRLAAAEADCWVQVHLGGSYPIDRVVLAPVLWRESQSDKVLPDGFP